MERIHSTINSNSLHHQLESTEAFKSAGLKIKIHENCRDIHENPYQSHEYWLCHLRMSPNLMVHLAGTCKMGLDNDKGKNLIQCY